MEQKTWWKAITYPERIDYLSFQNNELVFVLAIEKLLGLEVPEKATWMRMCLAELNRIHSHLVWLGDGRARAGRDLDVLVLLPRARLDPRPLRDGLRGAHAHALLPGRRARRGHPARLLSPRRASSSTGCRRPSTTTRGSSTRTRSGSSGRRGSGCSRPTTRSRSASPGRCCAAPGVDWDLRKRRAVPRLRPGRLRRARLRERRRLGPLQGAHGRDARVDAHRRPVPRPARGDGGRSRGSRTTARSCCRRARSCTPRWSR